MPEIKFRQKLVDELDPKSEEKILEFGFGTGANLLVAVGKNSSSNFTGLDIDPKVREIARSKLERHNVNIPLELYDGGSFPFESNYFDKVYSCLVFHQLDAETKSHCFNEIYRVLKPGGEVIIGDWGKAKSRLMRVMFYVVQLLDGFKTTTDNVNGLLPEYLRNAKFFDVKETGFINTRIGTFSYYKGKK